jgi:hypothetical protein
MAKKGSRFDTRTLLIILLVIVIIGAGYIVITNLPEEIDFVTPGEIVNNPSNFLGQEVIVKGYYDKDSADFDVIVSTLSTTGGEGREELKINIEKLRETNETDNLRTERLYYFTGKIEDEGNPVTPGIDVILIVEKFEDV